MNVRTMNCPLFFALALAGVSAPFSLAANPPGCHIAINTPAEGATVGRAGIVEGTAVFPANKYLWAFARIKGEKEVWPQAGGALNLDEDGTWSAHVYFGERDDIGSEFEVILQVVEARDNTLLDSWVQNSKAQRPPSSIKMPPSADGCPVRRVVVTKVSH